MDHHVLLLSGATQVKPLPPCGRTRIPPKEDALGLRWLDLHRTTFILHSSLCLRKQRPLPPVCSWTGAARGAMRAAPTPPVGPSASLPVPTSSVGVVVVLFVSAPALFLRGALAFGAGVRDHAVRTVDLHGRLRQVQVDGPRRVAGTHTGRDVNARVTHA